MASSIRREAALEVELRDQERDTPEDTGAQRRVVVADLPERLLPHRDGIRGATVVVADERPDAQRLGPGRPRRRLGDRGLEDAVRLDHLGQVDEQAFGGQPCPLEAAVGQVGRGHPIGIEVQRGRHRASRRGPGPPPAASAKAWATDSSGPSAACPRCRARASGDGVAVARAAWARRSSAAGARPSTAWAISGWLNRTVPLLDPDEARVDGRLAAPPRTRVGLARASRPWARPRLRRGAWLRARPSGARRPGRPSADPSESGIGSGTGGFDGSMSAGRARPISSAYSGLPPDAASTLTSTSRGNDRPSRSPSSLVEGRERQRPEPDPLGLLGRHGGRQVGRTLPRPARSGPRRAGRAGGRQAAGRRRRRSPPSSRRATGRRRRR